MSKFIMGFVMLIRDKWNSAKLFGCPDYQDPWNNALVPVQWCSFLNRRLEILLPVMQSPSVAMESLSRMYILFFHSMHGITAHLLSEVRIFTLGNPKKISI